MSDTELKPFEPIVPPPSDYHNMAAGISAELGDSARSAMTKINAGFAHVYAVLRGEAEATGGGLEEWVAKNFVSIKIVEELKATIAKLESKVASMMGPDAPQPQAIVKPAEDTAPSSITGTGDDEIKVTVTDDAK